MVIIGADHAGFDLKYKIMEKLKEKGIEYTDVTDYSIDQNDDYVDIAQNLAKEVLKKIDNFGIAICGTGIGISIACNKIKGIRAGVCYNKDVAKKIKEDNNCNIICFGGRQEENIDDIAERIDIFMDSSFQAGRHERRINKISELEEKFGCIK